MPDDLITVTNNENPPINLEITAYENTVNIDFLESVDSVLAGHNFDGNAHSVIINPIIEDINNLNTVATNKVDKIEGKGLSENDFTDSLKSNYDMAYTNNHIHSNKSDLDLVSGTNTGDQDLSGLATKTLNNLTLATALTNLGFAGQSLTANGYFKFPKGLIIQWGVTSNIVGGYSGNTTYPIAFTATPKVITMPVGSYSSSPQASDTITANSATGFTMASGTIGTMPFYWIAIGY